MEAESPLSPRKSALFVANHSSFDADGIGIGIDNDAVGKVAQMILDSERRGELNELDFSSCPVHPKSVDHSTVDWIFFIDLINFSFWSEDNAKRFVIRYDGVDYDGYYAACACVNRALDAGIPLINAKFMSEISEQQLIDVFASTTGVPIPLIAERLQVIREAGTTLIEKYEGTFWTALQRARGNAQLLLKMIVDDFPSFRDFAKFRGQQVSFLKRAQILIADIHNCFAKAEKDEDRKLGRFSDISTLTMFADYRVPQVLAFLGVLRYSDAVIQRLSSSALLENGSELEILIRAFSISACDKIVEKIGLLQHQEINCLRENDAIKEFDSNDPIQLNAIDVDVWLWLYRRKIANQLDAAGIPFHRCRCIFY